MGRPKQSQSVTRYTDHKSTSTISKFPLLEMVVKYLIKEALGGFPFFLVTISIYVLGFHFLSY